MSYPSGFQASRKLIVLALVAGGLVLGVPLIDNAVAQISPYDCGPQNTACGIGTAGCVNGGGVCDVINTYAAIDTNNLLMRQCFKKAGATCNRNTNYDCTIEWYYDTAGCVGNIVCHYTISTGLGCP